MPSQVHEERSSWSKQNQGILFKRDNDLCGMVESLLLQPTILVRINVDLKSSDACTTNSRYIPYKVSWIYLSLLI